MPSSSPAISPTGAVCEYLAAAGEMELAQDTIEAAKLHILDTIAAMVSGSGLTAGRQGAKAAAALGGPAEAIVIGTDHLVGAAAAALANGMAAHADETDDSHAPSLSHPGCAVVPAALAMGERLGASGAILLRAVVAGYDVGCRVGRALGRDAVDMRFSRPSSHAIVGTFGAAAAAAVIIKADQLNCRHILSYAAQRAAGVTTWQRDVDHVEKSFVFAGSPASSGVLVATMVDLGCTGVDDVFSGHPNWLDAVSRTPDPGELSKKLGERFEVVLTNIKRYSVGSPAQAAVQAAEEMINRYAPEVKDIAGIEILLPADLAGVVDDRGMPDVNVQYLVAGTLLDGRCSFAMSHDYARMNDQDITKLRRCTILIADASRAGSRSAELRVRLRDGRVLQAAVKDVRGTAQNPMNTHEVQAKALDVMSPVFGGERAEKIVAAIERIDELKDLRDLRDLLGSPPA